MLVASLSDSLASAWAILLMILGFSVVIFVHELGHFAMAKLAGVRVDKFAIGFGKELLGRTWGETRYSFNALPLGGYVKMLGQEDFEIDKEGEWKVKDDPRAFTNKPVGARMLIVSAGVTMNLVFAALAFMVVFMVGLKTMPAKVGHVMPGSAAHRAGLMPGDEILQIDDSKMDDFSDVNRAIMLADNDRPIRMLIRRPGRPQPFTIDIKPEWSELSKVRQIGITNPFTLRVGGIAVENPGDEGRKDRLHVEDLIKEVDGVKVQNHVQVEELITEKRGAPVKMIVDRPLDPNDPEGPNEPVTCYHEARMLIIGTGENSSDQHILGLEPRPLALDVTSGSPAAKAGVLPGDVIVKWGDQWNPTAEECKAMLRDTDEDGRYVHAGKNLEIIIRRAGMSKEIGIGPDRPTGTVISYRLLLPLLDARDDLIIQAKKDPAAARKKILEILGKQTKDEALLQDVRKDLDEKAATAQGVMRWLLNLDREQIILRPETDGIFSQTLPKVGIAFGTLEIDRLVVSRVVEKDLDDRPTPAAALNLPRGALITHINDQPVKTWLELIEAFRKHVTQEVTITYMLEGQVAKGKMKIPQTLKAALDLPPLAEVIKIAGKKAAKMEPDNKTVTLPFWGAAYEILKANQGREVPIVYRYGTKEIATGPDGKELTYAVTSDNYDPWLMRIVYSSLIIQYPERFVLRKKNPIAAMWMGFKKTGNFVLQVYKMMEHLIITQKVGVEHISGPVGILRIGHSVAQSGFTNLLYFLAFISANLAVINFLPLPVFDGGLMVFLILEKIRGRPVSIKMQVATQIIGLVLIVGIFVFVTFMDVSKWVTEG